jgi:phage shock protein PspC (stress-responsive transcriptional regulator)
LAPRACGVTLLIDPIRRRRLMHTDDTQHEPDRAETGPTAVPPGPKRLTRSPDDRVIGGVAGGLGRYFNIDPIIFRIAFAASLLIGGLGGLIYLAMWVFIPVADGPPGPGGPPRERSSALMIVAVVVLVLVAGPLLLAPVLLVLGAGLVAGIVLLPLAALALVGLLVWWLVTGDRPVGGARDVLIAVALGVALLILCSVIFVAGAWAAAAGGGTVIAALVIAAGAMLVAGAFMGGMRWLILPALALAVPVAFVAAADVDFDGGIGEREYRPTSVTQIRDRYELGMGSLVVDFRSVRLPPDDPTDVTLDVGVGEAVVVVPEDVCVGSQADVGIGAVEVFDHESGGVDVDWEEQPRARRGTPSLVVHGDIGVGLLQVKHAAPGEPFRDVDLGPGNKACETLARARRR